MKVEKFNSLFRKLGEFQLRYKVLYLIAISVITLLCSLGLPKLNLGGNEESWFSDWDTIKISQERFEDLFGADDSVMAFIEADDVFDPEVLAAIDRLGKRLENEVPYAKSVTSLTSLSIPKGTDDGFEILNPLEDFSEKKYSHEEIQKTKDFILSRDSLVNTLVSDDAKETWLILS